MAPRRPKGSGISILRRKLIPTGPECSCLASQTSQNVPTTVSSCRATGGVTVNRGTARNGCVGGLAAVDVVLLHHPQRHRRDREGGQRPAHVATGVAGLQAPGAHHVQGGAGDDAQLAGLADGAGQLPSGDGHPHPTLDDGREHVLVVHGTTCVVAALLRNRNLRWRRYASGWCRHRGAADGRRPAAGGVGDVANRAAPGTGGWPTGWRLWWCVAGSDECRSRWPRRLRCDVGHIVSWRPAQRCVLSRPTLTSRAC